ncbi:MAG: hypothetical protein GH155_00175 [Spirochaeta sp.]|nr:hypothetical protein [Spirochaeta sp.]
MVMLLFYLITLLSPLHVTAQQDSKSIETVDIYLFARDSLFLKAPPPGMEEHILLPAVDNRQIYRWQSEKPAVTAKAAPHALKLYLTGLPPGLPPGQLTTRQVLLSPAQPGEFLSRILYLPGSHIEAEYLHQGSMPSWSTSFGLKGALAENWLDYPNRRADYAFLGLEAANIPGIDGKAHPLFLTWQLNTGFSLLPDSSSIFLATLNKKLKRESSSLSIEESTLSSAFSRADKFPILLWEEVTAVLPGTIYGGYLAASGGFFNTLEDEYLFAARTALGGQINFTNLPLLLKGGGAAIINEDSLHLYPEAELEISFSSNLRWRSSFQSFLSLPVGLDIHLLQMNPQFAGLQPQNGFSIKSGLSYDYSPLDMVTLQLQYIKGELFTFSSELFTLSPVQELDLQIDISRKLNQNLLFYCSYIYGIALPAAEGISRNANTLRAGVQTGFINLPLGFIIETQWAEFPISGIGPVRFESMENVPGGKSTIQALWTVKKGHLFSIGTQILTGISLKPENFRLLLSYQIKG